VPEEPCQCPDCLRFYREHDRLIREFPTLRKQQEINWASLQSFRTLCGRVLEDLQKKLHSDSFDQSEENCQTGAIDKKEKSMAKVISDLENINAHLYSIEALMERIFDVKVPDEVEAKFREVAGELAPDPLHIDRLKLNRLLHQTPDLPDK
jgi:Zn-dependent oligopeptidase